jgi:hypothetical protein
MFPSQLNFSVTANSTAVVLGNTTAANGLPRGAVGRGVAVHLGQLGDPVLHLVRAPPLIFALCSVLHMVYPICPREPLCRSLSACVGLWGQLCAQPDAFLLARRVLRAGGRDSSLDVLSHFGCAVGLTAPKSWWEGGRAVGVLIARGVSDMGISVRSLPYFCTRVPRSLVPLYAAGMCLCPPVFCVQTQCELKVNLADLQDLCPPGSYYSDSEDTWSCETCPTGSYCIDGVEVRMVQRGHSDGMWPP